MRACSNDYLGCDGTVGDKAEHEECAKCRSHVKRWKGRKPDEVRRRHANLQVWDGRIKLHPALLKGKDNEKKNGTSHSKVTAIPLRTANNASTTTQVRKRA